MANGCKKVKKISWLCDFFFHIFKESKFTALKRDAASKLGM